MELRKFAMYFLRIVILTMQAIAGFCSRMARKFMWEQTMRKLWKKQMKERLVIYLEENFTRLHRTEKSGTDRPLIMAIHS